MPVLRPPQQRTVVVQAASVSHLQPSHRSLARIPLHCLSLPSVCCCAGSCDSRGKFVGRKLAPNFQFPPLVVDGKVIQGKMQTCATKFHWPRAAGEQVCRLGCCGSDFYALTLNDIFSGCIRLPNSSISEKTLDSISLIN